MVVFKWDTFEELYANRRAFLSKLVYQTYNGYAISQFRKIEDDIRLRKDIRWKHAMHLIRLLINGAELLRTGEVSLSILEHHDDLFAIRRGEMPWQQVNDWRNMLHDEFEIALSRTRLPDKPDYATLNRILLNARRRMVTL